MSRALYDSLESEVYCPAGANQGHLEFDVFRKVWLRSPAHTSASRARSRREDSRNRRATSTSRNLALQGISHFKGSRVERFITGSFDHTLKPGCSNTIAN